MNTITIAIDGYAGTGKSSTAKEVAKKLGYTYIDTGAMYRAVTLYFLQHHIPFDQVNPSMLTAIDQIELRFQESVGGSMCMYLNGENVAQEIRSPKVSENVSEVAVHKPVREKLVQQQRIMGQHGGVVMDGRDIGTVVFPKAELKIFMTANMQVRAIRRQEELREKGTEMSLEEVIENLSHRDQIDANRAIAPLKKAEDAIEMDTSFTTFEQQVEQLCKLAREKMEELTH
ncbi:MAG: (d)CMP kinase [Bacteroidota bacterium]